MVNLLNVGLGNEPSWWQYRDGELFDIFDTYKKIGSCTLTLVRDQQSPRNEHQFFPNSWFVDKTTDQMKPVLEVTGLETFQQRSTGNGRLCLQALYDLSQKKGCDGRIQALAAFGSAPFYEHCGFEGGKKGEDGLKYFNPTSQNVMRLFPAGFTQNHFCFIPITPRKVTKKEPRCTNNTLLNQSDRNFQRF